MKTAPCELMITGRRFFTTKASQAYSVNERRSIAPLSFRPLLQYLSNSGSHGIEVARVQRGHTDAARAHGIDAEFLTQTVHLCCRQTRVREHAALRVHEAEVAVHAACLQAFDQTVAHGADTVAHFAEFRFPRGAQFR